MVNFNDFVCLFDDTFEDKVNLVDALLRSHEEHAFILKR